MNTTKENILDYTKVKNLDREVLEDLALSIIENCTDIYNLNTSYHLSYSSWYKTYVISEEFQNLSRDKKKQIIEHYENINLLFEEMLSFLRENELGYNFNNFYN